MVEFPTDGVNRLIISLKNQSYVVTVLEYVYLHT
jgi:hypothetical protein